MLKDLTKKLLSLSVTGVVTLTLILFLSRWHWAAELFTHFRLPYIVGFTFTLSKAMWKPSAFVGVCLLIQLYSVSPHFLPFFKDKREGIGAELKVISYNVLSSNTDHENVLSFLEKEDADIVLLLEVNQTWMTALGELNLNYPYQIGRPRQDNFGILLLSKLPLTSHEVVRPSPEHSAFIVANLDWNGQNLRFFGAHPFTPLGGSRASARNISLKEIKRRSLATTDPQIIAGDLNCSAFSPHFHTLQKGLRDSARGRGYTATWRRGHPIWAIPIDHILTSESLVCADYQIGPKNGSDHSPLVGVYQLAK